MLYIYIIICIYIYTPYYVHGIIYLSIYLSIYLYTHIITDMISATSPSNWLQLLAPLASGPHGRLCHAGRDPTADHCRCTVTIQGWGRHFR